MNNGSTKKSADSQTTGKTSPKGHGGRPTKFTPEVTTRLLSCLAAGVPRSIAAKSSGIDYTTFARWMRDGEAETDENSEFYQFYHSATRAEADAAIRRVAAVEQAATGQDEVTTTRSTKQAIATETTTYPDGRVVRRDVPMTLVTTTEETVRKADWRAAAWDLERRYPDEYKRIERRELSGQNGGPLAIDAASLRQRMTAAEARAALEEAKRIMKALGYDIGLLPHVHRALPPGTLEGE